MILYLLVFKILNKDKYIDKWYGIDDILKLSFKIIKIFKIFLEL